MGTEALQLIMLWVTWREWHIFLRWAVQVSVTSDSLLPVVPRGPALWHWSGSRGRRELCVMSPSCAPSPSLNLSSSGDLP